MKENIFKALITTALAGLAVYFKALFLPLIVLFGLMILDYVTGMTNAWMTGELSSRKGIVGLVKKVGYFVVVCVGMTVDWIITTTLTQLGITYAATFAFGLLVIVWLIINELISIMENASKIGIPMPKFLANIISKLKVSVENKGEPKEDGGEIDG